MSLSTLKTRARPVAMSAAAVVAVALVSELYARIHGNRCHQDGYLDGYHDGIAEGVLEGVRATGGAR